MGNPHKHEIPKTGKMKYMYVTVDEKGLGSGTSEGMKSTHRKMNNGKCQVNKCFLGHQKKWD